MIDPTKVIRELNKYMGEVSAERFNQDLKDAGIDFYVVEKKDIYYHEIYKDAIIGGLLIGELGSMKYILNEETHEPLTKGYHNIWLHEGTLMGNVGACKEIISVK